MINSCIIAIITIVILTAIIAILIVISSARRRSRPRSVAPPAPRAGERHAERGRLRTNA